MSEGPSSSLPSPGTKKNPVSKPPGKKGPSSTPASEKGSRLRKGSKKSSLSPTGSKKDLLSPTGNKKDPLSPAGSKKDSLSPTGSKKDHLSPAKSKKGSVSPTGGKKGSPLPAGSKKDPLSPSGSKKDSLSPSGSKKDPLSPAGSKKDSLSPSGSKKDTLSPAGSKKDPLSSSGSKKNSLSRSGSKKDSLSPSGSKKDTLSPSGSKKDPISPGGSKKDSLSPAGSKSGPLSPAERKGSVPLASTKKTVSQPEKIKASPLPGSKKRSASEPLGEDGVHASPKDAPVLGGMAPGGNETLDPAPGSDRSGTHRSEAKGKRPQPLSTPPPRRGRRSIIIGVLVVSVIVLAALLLLLMSKASKSKGTPPQPSTDVISSRTSPSSSFSTSSYSYTLSSISLSSPSPFRTTSSTWPTPSPSSEPTTTYKVTPPTTTTYKVTERTTRPPDGESCNEEACRRVASELLEGLSPNSRPCNDFYGYVCGQWKGQQAYEAKLFQQLVDDVAEESRAQTRIPASGQTATQKAARAYQACENIVAKNSTNMATVKRILTEAGFFSSKEWTRPLDILDASFFLAATWRIASPFRIEYVHQTGLGLTLRLGPSQSAVAYVSKRGRPEWKARSKGDFDQMQETFQADSGEAKISYDEWKSIDERVTDQWRHILDTWPGETMFQGWDETTVYDSIPEIKRTDWEFLLKKYFNSSGALRLYVGSPKLLGNFADIPARFSAKQARAFYRWYMVETLACVVYSPWVIRRFGDHDIALKHQRRFCFAIMEKSAGYAFLAPYIKRRFTAQVVHGIDHILHKVRDAYVKDLFAGSTVFPLSIKELPGYDFSQGRFFRLLNVSDASTLDKHYAKYEDMTDDPLVNWKRLRTGLTESSYSDVTMTSVGADIKSVRFFTIDPYGRDFAVRPDLAALPFLDPSLPPELKLAGLGPILASAMIETLRAGKIGWSQRESVAWNEARACMPSNRHDLLERTVALAAVVSALKKSYGASQMALKDVPQLSDPLQVLFAAWCHLQCGEKNGKELCNEPLRELNSFFGTFKCGDRDNMKKAKKCTAGWFQV